MVKLLSLRGVCDEAISSKKEIAALPWVARNDRNCKSCEKVEIGDYNVTTIVFTLRPQSNDGHGVERPCEGQMGGDLISPEYEAALRKLLAERAAESVAGGPKQVSMVKQPTFRDPDRVKPITDPPPDG